MCTALIDANPTGMCVTCSKTQVDITDGITKEVVIQYCKQCDRYQRPPWVRLKPESNELMSFLLSKIKGMGKVKLGDADFIWTEPHSKTIKIKITIFKEFQNSMLQSSLIVEFQVIWTQCEECKKTFTPHLWNACCQVRQKVNHKRTFLYLEQMLLKNSMHSKALHVKETPEGVDLFFSNRSHANCVSDFIKSVLPCKVKTSKQLVSHDMNSNLYNYKYTNMIEIAPICKDDLIVIDDEQMKSLGGIGPVLLCYKICSNVHLIDPLTMEVIEFDENNYWRHEVRSYIDRSTLVEFQIMNIEEEIDYKKLYAVNNIISNTNEANDIDMVSINSHSAQSKSTNFKNVKNKNLNSSQYTVNKSKREMHNFKIVKVDCIKLNQKENSESSFKLFSFRTHIGERLNVGDIVLGYDLTSLNNNLIDFYDNGNLPEIVLVKKKYIRSNDSKRVWKLKRMNIEEEETNEEKSNRKKVIKTNNMPSKEEQYEEFLRDIEENKDIRKNVNLYKDDDIIKELQDKLGNLKVEDEINKRNQDFDLKVTELIDALKIETKEENDNEEIVDTKFDGEFKKPYDVVISGNKKTKKIKGAKNIDEQVEESAMSSIKNKELKSKRNRQGSKVSSDSKN